VIESSALVREARPAEIDDCVELWVAAVAHRDGRTAPAVDPADDPVLVAVRARAEEKFRAPRVACLVVPGDGRPDGFALLTAPGTGRPTDPADAVYLSLLAVRPGVQARGVGRALLTATVRAAAAAGHSRVALHVLADNDRAVRLYEAGGFRPTGTEFPHAVTGIVTRTYATERH
jgi:ribosomal protein S18 acetylase RimI-like enzyme